jgi:hypothetical protein
LHTYRFHALVVAILVVAAIASSANAGLLKQSGDTTLSVYGAYEKVTQEPGVWLAISKHTQGGLADISGAAFNHSIILQTSQLRPITSGSLPIYVGMTAAYSFANNNTSVQDGTLPAANPAPTGFMSGVQLVLAKVQPSSGLALDLRISSLSKGVNPIKWITNPDALCVGAGMSYSF